MSSHDKFRNWAFTLNNYSILDYDAPKSWSGVKYAVIAREVGESGTPHLQGQISFVAQRNLSGLKKLFPKAHWERTINLYASIKYCMKDGDYYEIGQRPKSKEELGKSEQERWQQAKQFAISGQIDKVPDDIYVRYYRTLKDIKKDHMEMPADCTDVTGYWIYGPPGYGKSRFARAHNPDFYDKMPDKWWDGYQDQASVIIDDLDKYHVSIGSLLKRWSDRYSFHAESKGGAMQIRPKRIVVTSNYSIEEIWSQDNLVADALKRRFKVLHIVTPMIFDENGKVTPDPLFG